MDDIYDIEPTQQVKLIFPCGKTKITSIQNIDNYEFQDYELV
jgi:hypothetical protein